MVQEMSLDLFGEIFPVFVPKSSTEELKLAKALASDSEQHTGEGARQQEYAEMARSLIAEAETDAHRTQLSRIAVWHYERCAADFRRAVVSFESAARIQKDEKTRRTLSEKAKVLAESVMQAELAALELTRDEKKKKED